MKMAKRWLALLLSVVMILGALAGCSKKANEESNGDSQVTAAPTTQAAGDSSEGTAEEDTYADKLTFTMSVIDAEKAGLTDNGEVAENFKWLCDKFNVEFDFWPLTWSNYVDQTRMWLNSDSAPDLIMLDVAPTRYSEYLDWVDAGLFKAYPDLNNYENLKMRYDAMTSGKKFEVDGQLYAWPAYSDFSKYNYAASLGYTYRKDWAQAVGLWQEDESYTMDEWNELVKAVIAQDPGKNGAGKTIGMITPAAWGFPKYIVGSVSPYLLSFEKDDSGKWVWGPTLPESLEAVKTAKQMYDDGIIWSDQPMVTDADASNNLSAGKLFSIVNTNVTVGGLYTPIKAFVAANPGVNPEDTFSVANIEGADGKYLTWEGSDQWSQTAMNHNISDEKAERWSAILNFLVSDDGYNFRTYGIQDKDWKYDASGNVECLWTTTDDQGNLVNPYGTGGTWPWARAAGSTDGFAIDNPAFPQWIRDIARKQSELYSSDKTTIIPKNIDFAFFTSEAYDNATAGLEAEIYQKIAELMASKDIETDWTNWVNQKLPEVQPALDELNANVK